MVNYVTRIFASLGIYHKAMFIFYVLGKNDMHYDVRMCISEQS